MYIGTQPPVEWSDRSRRRARGSYARYIQPTGNTGRTIGGQSEGGRKRGVEYGAHVRWYMYMRAGGSNDWNPNCQCGADKHPIKSWPPLLLLIAQRSSSWLWQDCLTEKHRWHAGRGRRVRVARLLVRDQQPPNGRGKSTSARCLLGECPRRSAATGVREVPHLDWGVTCDWPAISSPHLFAYGAPLIPARLPNCPAKPCLLSFHARWLRRAPARLCPPTPRGQPPAADRPALESTYRLAAIHKTLVSCRVSWCRCHAPAAEHCCASQSAHPPMAGARRPAYNTQLLAT